MNRKRAKRDALAKPAPIVTTAKFSADARTSRQADLATVSEQLLKSYRDSAAGHRVGRHALASRDAIIAIIDLLLALLYPGYFGQQELEGADLLKHTAKLLSALESSLAKQIQLSLCLPLPCGRPDLLAEKASSAKGHELSRQFVLGLPNLRELLLEDVKAAYSGDPAARSLDEVILAYPGMLAVTVYRMAHALYQLEVPLLPRVMTEWAHSQTGADIHPGATVGPRFFIDHATGVVIGETTTIGADVKLYQGVTLGALSIPHDSNGDVVRGTKRHPTLEDDVTIYANATVLGGGTVIGAHSVIGGSVFVTKSVPPYSRVALTPPAHRVGSLSNVPSMQPADEAWDWSI